MKIPKDPKGALDFAAAMLRHMRDERSTCDELWFAFDRAHDRLRLRSSAIGGLLAAEAADLGAALIAGRSPAHRDWLDDRHKAVAGIMAARAAKGLPVDLVSVVDHIVATNTINKCGGLTYVSQLPDRAAAAQPN